MIVDPSAISWGAIGNRLAIGRRLVGDCILSVCSWLQKHCNFLEIGRQPIGDWLAISRRLKTVSGLSATAATGRRSVANQSATCRRPPKTFLRSIWSQRGFTCSNQNLLATKSSLQPSATGRRPDADLLVTTLQPPCDHPKFWSQGGRRPVASYVWLGLNASTSRTFTVRSLCLANQSWWWNFITPTLRKFPPIGSPYTVVNAIDNHRIQYIIN